jgi:CubicO group peptidase (beta-lactamase class C family)
MNLSSFERQLLQKVEVEIPGVTPGLQIQVHQAGKKVCDIAAGTTYPYYDFASLTKIVFTTQVLMKAFEDGLWNLETKVAEFCSWLKHKDIKVVDCLTHSSGLIWWLPLYKSLNLNSTSKERWLSTQSTINELNLELSAQSVYSDVGFILLGHFLEAIYQKDLIEIWSLHKEQNYPRTTINFHPENKPKFDTRLYAPTERCQWRGKLIQGEVHDDNTWALGGVSSHAGLFGSIDDLGWFALYLRSTLQGFAKTFVKQRTAMLFTSRARPQGQGDWALGFMMPTPGKSSSGDHFSLASVGHTGFTGTSLWYDPVFDISISILSNRVFYSRENKQFAELRPKIHNWIVESLRKV